MPDIADAGSIMPIVATATVAAMASTMRTAVAATIMAVVSIASIMRTAGMAIIMRVAIIMPAATTGGAAIMRGAIIDRCTGW